MRVAFSGVKGAFANIAAEKIFPDATCVPYGDFKLAVGETVADSLDPIRNRFNELMADKAYLESIMKNGADKANYMASKTLSKVYKKVGLLPRIR